MRCLPPPWALGHLAPSSLTHFRAVQTYQKTAPNICTRSFTGQPTNAATKVRHNHLTETLCKTGVRSEELVRWTPPPPPPSPKGVGVRLRIRSRSHRHTGTNADCTKHRLSMTAGKTSAQQYDTVGEARGKPREETGAVLKEHRCRNCRRTAAGVARRRAGRGGWGVARRRLPRGRPSCAGNRPQGGSGWRVPPPLAAWPGP